MNMDRKIITYDIGSTGCKTCFYKFDGKLDLIDSAVEGYEFTHLDNGGVEQNPEDWWRAMCITTKAILSRQEVKPSLISGLSFCAQMQGLVLVDNNLNVLRPAMSYLDQRALAQKRDGLEHGIKIEGMNALKLFKSLRINGAIAASVKDPVWKYKWVEENEPDIFSKIYKWLDVKDYLIMRACGKCTMTRDSAFATFLTVEKQGILQWSSQLMKMYGVNPDHLPEIIDSTAAAGKLSLESSKELGLIPGIPVFGGGGDASMITVGAGATRNRDCYVYTGTSGWVSCTVEEKKVDIGSRIASIVGAQPDMYNFFAEQETAGKCLEWVRDHLAKDEIDLYLDKRSVVDGTESKYKSMYEYLIESIGQVPPGSGGVIFTPWLHGNRSPFEDPYSRAIFFNISLEIGKRALIRAVVEGIIFHQRWLLESIEKSFKAEGPLRFAGGGALSPYIAQIMADIMGRRILTVEHPQNCGAAGAALTAAIGLGYLDDFSQVKKCIEVTGEFMQDKKNSGVYERQYRIFCKLYKHNMSFFKDLNSNLKKE